MKKQINYGEIEEDLSAGALIIFFLGMMTFALCLILLLIINI
jgi:hypothetical protein